ncbi:von Willebrand factor type A domain-containing protein [Xylaria arbuscula]|nr:von Willebrand factor type A domain-containing protein [Xylaria arbuscula]
MDTLRPQIHWQQNHVAEQCKHIEDRQKPRSTSESHAINLQEDQAYTTLGPDSTLVSICTIDHATKVMTALSFTNPKDDILHKAAFSFPLPNGASLMDFKCSLVGDRIIQSEVKPLSKAVADFDRAASNNKVTSLLAQVTPEIFTVALGNIPRKAKLEVSISLVMTLKERSWKNERVSTLTIPTYIAPRYGEKPPAFLETVKEHAQHSFKMDMNIISTDEIISITSSSHAIFPQISRGPRPCNSWNDFANSSRCQGSAYKANVKLKNPLKGLDGDLVIDVITKPSAGILTPRAWVEAHASMQDHHAVMLHLPSNMLLREHNDVQKSEILFLVDRSGSMKGKMRSLKSAMMFFLKGLPIDQRFNIWSFGTDHTSLWRKSRAKTRETLEMALEHVARDFQSDMGGTELLPSLRAIFKARSSSHASGFSTTDIVLLTDGEVWNQEDTINFVQSARTHSGFRVRFFCLGIGPAVSHTLVNGIAIAGGGCAEFVPPSLYSGWEDRAVLLLKAALHSHVDLVRLEIGEDTGSGFRPWKDTSRLQSPSNTALLSPFLNNRIYWLLESSKLPFLRMRIRVETKEASGKTITHEIVPTPLQESHSILNALAARAVLDEFERGVSWLHRQAHPNADTIRLEGERIAYKWSLASKWTAFVGVERINPVCTLSESLANSVDAICDLSASVWDPDLLRPVGYAQKSIRTRKLVSLVADGALSGVFESSEQEESDDSSDSSDDNSDCSDEEETYHYRKDNEDDDPSESSSYFKGSGAPPSGGAGFGPPPSGGGESSPKNEPGSQDQNSYGNSKSYQPNDVRHIHKSLDFPQSLNKVFLQRTLQFLGWPSTLKENTDSITPGRRARPQVETQDRICVISTPIATDSRSPIEANESGISSQVYRPTPQDSAMNVSHAQALFRRLARLQSYDGFFDFGPKQEEALVELFGKDIRGAFNSLIEVVTSNMGSSDTNKPHASIAVMLIVVAVLRVHFDHYYDYWILIVERANDFIKNMVGGPNEINRATHMAEAANAEAHKLTIEVLEEDKLDTTNEDHLDVIKPTFSPDAVSPEPPEEDYRGFRRRHKRRKRSRGNRPRENQSQENRYESYYGNYYENYYENRYEDQLPDIAFLEERDRLRENHYGESQYEESQYEEENYVINNLYETSGASESHTTFQARFDSDLHGPSWGFTR